MVNVCKVGVLLDIMACLLFVSCIGYRNRHSLSDFCRVSPVFEVLLFMCGPLDE